MLLLIPYPHSGVHKGCSNGESLSLANMKTFHKTMPALGQGIGTLSSLTGHSKLITLKHFLKIMQNKKGLTNTRQSTILYISCYNTWHIYTFLTWLYLFITLLFLFFHILYIHKDHTSSPSIMSIYHHVHN